MWGQFQYCQSKATKSSNHIWGQKPAYYEGVQVIKENCRLNIWLLNANVYTELYFYDHGSQNCVFYLLFWPGQQYTGQ